MSSNLTIEVTQQQGRVPVTVFQLKGSVDAGTADQLEQQAVTAYDNGTRNLVLDLSKVDYMSSAGLRALHAIFTMLRADTDTSGSSAIDKGLRDGTFKSPHLKLVNPSNPVRQVLSTVGFDMFIEVYRNLKEALASF